MHQVPRLSPVEDLELFHPLSAVDGSLVDFTCLKILIPEIDWVCKIAPKDDFGHLGLQFADTSEMIQHVTGKTRWKFCHAS